MRCAVGIEMSKISIIGTGYVGLVTGATLAAIGHDVECLDVSKDKIDQLNRGVVPFHEPGLSELINDAVNQGRIQFSLVSDVKNLSHEFHFLAVGTPEKEDGSADLKYINEAVNFIAENAEAGSIIVTKSTVPIGTNKAISEKVAHKDIHLVSNPEFLREGSAVEDSLNPDRIIIGSSSIDPAAQVRALYKKFQTKCSILEVSWEDAELTKYAANAFLATKISFMNEIAQICDKVKADVKNVKNGMVLDPRINDAFMDPGCGYGGSCFPKDVLALEETAKQNNLSLNLLAAVDRTNDVQKTYILDKFLEKHSLKNANVSVLGLAFKPNTDDVREAPSQTIIEYLVAKNAAITAFDPKASQNFRTAMLNKNITNFTIANTAAEALQNPDIIILCTEWSEFLNLEDEICKINSLKHVIDGRNFWKKEVFENHNINYYGVGR